MNAKKRIILLLALFVLNVQSACDKYKLSGDEPKCLIEKIKTFDSNTACNDEVKVVKYKFQNTYVYVFDPGNCGADMTSEVIDSECNTLGYLGGIMGNTKINGEDFSNAQEISILWKK